MVYNQHQHGTRLQKVFLFLLTCLVQSTYFALISRPQISNLRSQNQASESKQLCVTRFFFFNYYLATSTTDWAEIFTGLLFYAYVEIDQLNSSLWQLPIVSTVFKKEVHVNKHVPVSLVLHKLLGIVFSQSFWCKFYLLKMNASLKIWLWLEAQYQNHSLSK